MKWIYLSYILDNLTPGYGGKKEIKIESKNEIRNGDSCNSSIWFMSNHIGTHVDMPLHFFKNGTSLEFYESEFWVFNHIKIIDISPVEPGYIIRSEDLPLSNIPINTELLLIKTGFSSFRNESVYWRQNPGFHPNCAVYLRNLFPNLRSIGFDTISLSSFINRELGRKSHLSFLGLPFPILPVEDMDLSNIDEKTRIKKMIISPLRVKGGDASPCTVFAEVY